MNNGTGLVRMMEIYLDFIEIEMKRKEGNEKNLSVGYWGEMRDLNRAREKC